MLLYSGHHYRRVESFFVSSPIKSSPVIAELDRYLSAIEAVEARICGALSAGSEATFRLVIKIDRGRFASLRLESNEDLADQKPKTSLDAEPAVMSESHIV